MVEYVLDAILTLLNALPSRLRWLFSGRKEPFEIFVKNNPRQWFDSFIGLTVLIAILGAMWLCIRIVYRERF